MKKGGIKLRFYLIKMSVDGNEYSVLGDYELFINAVDEFNEMYKMRISYIDLEVLDTHKDFIVKYFKKNKIIIIADLVNEFEHLLAGENNQDHAENVMNFCSEILRNVLEQDLNEIIIAHSVRTIMDMEKYAFDENISIKKGNLLENYEDSLSNYFKESEENTLWYRGQKDAEYTLIPSIFRNKTKEDNTVWTNELMEKIYSQLEVRDKFKYIFDITEGEKSKKKVSFSELAFYQHTLAYSPLLDVTSNPRIALSFAIGNLINSNSIIQKDCAVYMFNIKPDNYYEDEDLMNKKLGEIEIETLNENCNITSVLKSDLWDELVFKKKKKSEIILSNIKTNDRMKMQKGAFYIYNNVIIIGGHVLFSYEENQSPPVYKFVIKKNDKFKYYKELKKDNKYNQMYLMNPYKYILS